MAWLIPRPKTRISLVFRVRRQTNSPTFVFVVMKNHESLVKCRLLYVVLWLVGLWLDVTFDNLCRPLFDGGRHAPIDSSVKPIVWVLGGPGSGKGTQCDKIIAKYGFTHLSTGDLLRAEVKSGSDRAKCLTSIMERGDLVPNEIVLDLLKEAMEAKADTAKGFLVDGYPREKSQGIAFENSIAPVTVIVYFECSSETLTKRLLGRAASSGRADDNEETIKLRLKTFLDNNAQVLAQYPDKLKRINAEESVDKIFGEVQKILDPIVSKLA